MRNEERKSEDKYPEHEIISKLVSDPSKVDSHLKLEGYLGRSDEPGHIRIYRSLDDLSEYLEIAEAEIKHTEPAAESVLPHQGSCVWVHAKASIRHVQTHTTTFAAAEVIAAGQSRRRLRLNKETIKNLRSMEAKKKIDIWVTLRPKYSCITCNVSCQAPGACL